MRTKYLIAVAIIFVLLTGLGTTWIALRRNVGFPNYKFLHNATFLCHPSQDVNFDPPMHESQYNVPLDYTTALKRVRAELAGQGYTERSEKERTTFERLGTGLYLYDSTFYGKAESDGFTNSVRKSTKRAGWCGAWVIWTDPLPASVRDFVGSGEF